MTYLEAITQKESVKDNIGKPSGIKNYPDNIILDIIVAPVIMSTPDKLDFFKNIITDNLYNENELKKLNLYEEDLEVYVVYKTGSKDTDMQFQNVNMYSQLQMNK